MINERDGISLKQIRKKSICGFCVYSNWGKEVSDEQDWFFCDLYGDTEPLFADVDECEDLDTGEN